MPLDYLTHSARPILWRSIIDRMIVALSNSVMDCVAESQIGDLPVRDVNLRHAVRGWPRCRPHQIARCP